MSSYSSIFHLKRSMAKWRAVKSADRDLAAIASVGERLPAGGTGRRSAGGHARGVEIVYLADDFSADAALLKVKKADAGDWKMPDPIPLAAKENIQSRSTSTTPPTR